MKYLYYDTTDKAFKESTQSAEPLPTTSGSSQIYLSGWYYVKGNVSIDKRLYLNGDTHIILCDDANLIIKGENSYVNGSSYKLSVYAQSNCGHAGAISVTSSTVNTIDVNDFTIHGGKVSSTANNKKAVRVSNDFTIYGGQLNATANWKSGDAIYIQGNMTVNNGQVTATANGEDGHAIYSASTSTSAALTVNGGKLTATALGEGGRAVFFENVVINGGQVTTGVDNYGWGGGFNVNTLTLGWTNASDYFKVTVSSWSVYTKWTAAKSFWIDGSGTMDANTVIEGSNIVSSFDGKKFTPKTDAAVYKISVSSAITGGTVVADKEIAFEGEKVTLSVTPDEGVILNSISCSDGTNDIPVTNEYGNYTFVMPAADVTVTGTPHFYTTGVKYLDWDDNEKKLVEKNTATDDNDANDKVYILDGTETTLGTIGQTTWYISNTPATTNPDGIGYSRLKFYGDVHLILADGSVMSVSDGIYCESGSITIYGQDYGTGFLKAIGDNFPGIWAEEGNITINGGIVEATSQNGCGLYTLCLNDDGAITINGGRVTATGGEYGISTSSKMSVVTIKGGQVEATGGIKGIYTPNSIENAIISINLGWTNTTDYIKVNSYESDDAAKIIAGKYFYDGSKVYGSATADYIFGAEGNATLGDIANKKLIPALPIDASQPYFMRTFDGNWKPIGGGKTFLPDGYDLAKGVVTLKEVAGAPDGQPVIFGPEDEKQPSAQYFVVGASGDEAKTIQDDYDNVVKDMSKRFVITDGTKTLAEILEGIKDVDASEAVVLMLVNSKFTTVDVSTDEHGKKTKAGLLLFVLSKWEYMHIKPSNSSAATSGNTTTRTIGIGDGEATGISEVTLRQAQGPSDDAWYLLDGRKLSGQPTKKGIYIYKGQKVKR